MIDKLDWLRRAFHDRMLALADDLWCPYPGTLFMEIVVMAPEEVAIALIRERRTMTFPRFWCRDPMQDSLAAIAGELNICYPRYDGPWYDRGEFDTWIAPNSKLKKVEF